MTDNDRGAVAVMLALLIILAACGGIAWMLM